MQVLSLQRCFIASGLILGLVACGGAAPGYTPTNNNKESVAAGPLGPPPPADDATVKPSDNPLPPPPHTNPPLAITESPSEGRMPERAAEDKDDKGVLLGDPLLGPAPSGTDPLQRGAVATGAKGPSHGTSATDGRAGSGGANTIGAATEVRGSIDKEEIRRVVRLHIPEVKRCYEMGLQRRPDLEGKVVLKFTIGKTGTVVAATVQETTLNERQVEQCIVGAAMKWTFPKPAGEGVVTISYPFLFKAGS